MFKIIIIVGLFLHILTHQGCIHDQLVRNHKLIPIDDTETFGRRLQTTQYGPIRFYLHYDTDIDQQSTSGLAINKIMNIITLFWQNTLEVYYPKSLTFKVDAGKDLSQILCLSFTIPRSIINTPIPNADYGIFIQSKNDGANGITAYSYPCAYSTNTNNPIWGILAWNLNYFNFDLLSFQVNVKIGIHQMTHLLGFSNILYQNYLHGKIVRTSKGTFLNGTFIQKALRQQFGCVNGPGMLLESGGGSGTALSHWSYKSVYNEFMTAGVLISNPTISYLTLALLEETGWYKTVSKRYGQYVNWGYQKGCRMLDPRDCQSDEYCTKQGTLSCDYDQTSIGVCKNQTLTGCLFVKFYQNVICNDPNFLKKNINANITNGTGQSGGQFSRCFSSNLILRGATQSKYQFRCYSALCSSSGKSVTIQIGNSYAYCIFPGQNITVPGYDGFLICPKSFRNICSIKRCPSECNGNGVCLNGKCLCSSSYSGQSCSQVTSTGFASTTPIGIASNNQNCLIGSYLTEFGDCQPCIENCASCDVKGCKVCTNGNLPGLSGKC